MRDFCAIVWDGLKRTAEALLILAFLVAGVYMLLSIINYFI